MGHPSCRHPSVTTQTHAQSLTALGDQFIDSFEIFFLEIRELKPPDGQLVTCLSLEAQEKHI